MNEIENVMCLLPFVLSLPLSWSVGYVYSRKTKQCGMIRLHRNLAKLLFLVNDRRKQQFAFYWVGYQLILSITNMIFCLFFLKSASNVWPKLLIHYMYISVSIQSAAWVFHGISSVMYRRKNSKNEMTYKR